MRVHSFPFLQSGGRGGMDEERCAKQSERKGIPTEKHDEKEYLRMADINWYNHPPPIFKTGIWDTPGHINPPTRKNMISHLQPQTEGPGQSLLRDRNRRNRKRCRSLTSSKVIVLKASYRGPGMFDLNAKVLVNCRCISQLYPARVTEWLQDSRTAQIFM